MSYIVPRDKPQECETCPYINLYNNCRLIRGSERIRTVEEQYWRCPLISIPTPHGRLIDADFEEQHYTSMTTSPTPDVTEQDKHNSLVIVRALQMAKTIIEAEE